MSCKRHGRVPGGSALYDIVGKAPLVTVHVTRGGSDHSSSLPSVKTVAAACRQVRKMRTRR